MCYHQKLVAQKNKLSKLNMALKGFHSEYAVLCKQKITINVPCAFIFLTGGDVSGHQESAEPHHAEHRWHLLSCQASFQLQQALHRCESS